VYEYVPCWPITAPLTDQEPVSVARVATDMNGSVFGLIEKVTWFWQFGYWVVANGIVIG
jgi:hypothetical protein